MQAPTGVIDIRDAARRRTRSRTQYNDLFDDRRQELAGAALNIWSEDGYWQVSVRNVAQRTGLGHGLVHYYFKNKAALITECLHSLEDEFARRRFAMEKIVEVPALSRAVSRAITDSFVQAPHLHRVRYDLRHQAQYVPELQSHTMRLEQVARDWLSRVHHRYVALGWQATDRFELTAIQLDARVEHAVRGRFGGHLEEADPHALYRDCLLILPS